MAFTTIPTSWIAVGKTLKQSLFQYIKDNFDAHETSLSQLTSDIIPNGSLENADGSSLPVSWTRTLYTGGSGAYDTSDFCHGTKSYKFTRPSGASNGGGELVSDYIFCSFLKYISFYFGYRADAASMKVGCYIRFYDASKVFISEWTAWETTSCDLGWTLVKITDVAPLANARYYKIKLVGGAVDATYNAAGSIWFDMVDMPHNILPGGGMLSETIDMAETDIASAYLSWTTFNSPSITVPTWAKYLYVWLEVRGNQAAPGAGAGNMARIGIGTTYSGTVEHDDEGADVYARGLVFIDVSALSGARTLLLQGYRREATGYMRSPIATNRKYYVPKIITANFLAQTVSTN